LRYVSAQIFPRFSSASRAAHANTARYLGYTGVSFAESPFFQLISSITAGDAEIEREKETEREREREREKGRGGREAGRGLASFRGA